MKLFEKLSSFNLFLQCVSWMSLNQDDNMRFLLTGKKVFFCVRQILQSISVMNSSSLDQQKRSFWLNNKFDEAIPNLFFFSFWASSRNNLFRILKIVQSCFHTNLAPNQRPTIIRFLSPNAIVYVALKKDRKLNFIEIFFCSQMMFQLFLVVLAS